MAVCHVCQLKILIDDINIEFKAIVTLKEVLGFNCKDQQICIKLSSYI